MGTEAENVAILRKAYADWSGAKAASIDCWVSIMADDARLTSLADGAAAVPFTRSRGGRSEIIEYLEGLTKDWEMLSYDVDEFVAQDDRVVAIGSTSWRNKLTRKIVDTPKIDIWRMRGGKVIEFSEFYDTARIYEASQP